MDLISMMGGCVVVVPYLPTEKFGTKAGGSQHIRYYRLTQVVLAAPKGKLAIGVMNQTGIYIFGQPASTGRIGEGLDRGVVQSESNGA